MELLRLGIPGTARLAEIPDLPHVGGPSRDELLSKAADDDDQLVEVLAYALDEWLRRPPPRENWIGKYVFHAIWALQTGLLRRHGEPASGVFEGLLQEWTGTAEGLVEAAITLAER